MAPKSVSLIFFIHSLEVIFGDDDVFSQKIYRNLLEKGGQYATGILLLMVFYEDIIEMEILLI